MNLLEWKIKLHGKPYRGGEGGGGGGEGGGNTSGPSVGGPDVSAGSAMGNGGVNDAETAGGPAGAAEAPSGASEAPSGPAGTGGGTEAPAASVEAAAPAVEAAAPAVEASGPAPGTPGPGKAGELAVGGWGDVSGRSAAATEATAEIMGSTMNAESARSQLEAGGMSVAERGQSQKGFSTTGISEAAMEGLSNAGLGGMDLGPNQPAGSSQNIDQALASINFADNVAPVIGGLVTAAVPGAGMALSLAKMAAAVKDDKISFEDAAKNVVASLIGGQINKAVMGALPADVAKGIAGYNTAATIGRAFDVNMPSINPGGYVAGAISNGAGMGVNSGPVGTDGTSINYGGYGMDGNGSSATTAPSAPAAPAAPANPGAPAANVLDRVTNMRAGFNGAAAGSAIRQGAFERQRQQTLQRQRARAL